MAEKVTMKGQPLNLKGPLLKVGDKIPDCELVGSDLKPVRLSSFAGKPFLLMSVPSLDTDVCSREAHRFNTEIDKFQGQITAVCVSMDLPFAQKRWCAAEGVTNLVVLSDFKNRSFGEKFGLLIPDLGLLARAVYIVDPQMRIQSAELVKEVTHEPNYGTVLSEIQRVLKVPRP